LNTAGESVSLLRLSAVIPDRSIAFEGFAGIRLQCPSWGLPKLGTFSKRDSIGNARPKAATIRKELRHVRAFCSYLVTRGLLLNNPADRVRPTKNGATQFARPSEAWDESMQENLDCAMERFAARMTGLLALTLR
jgi:hypothetical protein